MSARGYVVRGKDDRGRSVWADADDENGYEPRRGGKAVCVDSADAACFAKLEIEAQGCTDVVILAVAKDGTETVLPTYEQALAELAVEHARLDQAGALAVLEAAERRLLEAGGWEERDAGWLDGQRRLIWTRENAVKIERNRQATKAGVLRAKEER